MKKYITYALLAIIVILILWCIIPKSCEPSGKFEQLEAKSKQSLAIDSMVSAKTDSLIFANNAQIRRLNDSIAKIHIEKERLSVSYYALRATIKTLKIVRVDSLNQVVEVPAEQYNASINSGTMCDSLLMYMDQELQIKDSIISIRDIDVKALENLASTKQEANNDLIAFVAELKTDLKKSKNQNKGLKIALVIDTLLHLIH